MDEEEKKRKAEERKKRILSKGASRMALVKGEVPTLESEPINTERPLASRRAKELAIINEISIQNADDTSQSPADESLIEKLKENVQRRKEIEEKVIQCTEEFDRQHSNLTTSPQPADNQEKPTPISSEEELTVEKSEQFIETRVTTANLHENTSHSLLLTQSQLKDLLRLFFTVFFAILCGLFHARESQYCAISHTGMNANYASPEDAREQLLAFAKAHYDEEAMVEDASCTQPSFLIVFITHPLISIALSWILSSSLAPILSLFLAIQTPTKSASFFSTLLSILMSGYSGLLGVFFDIFGQFSLHLLITLCVSSFLHLPPTVHSEL